MPMVFNVDCTEAIVNFCKAIADLDGPVRVSLTADVEDKHFYAIDKHKLGVTVNHADSEEYLYDCAIGLEEYVDKVLPAIIESRRYCEIMKSLECDGIALVNLNKESYLVNIAIKEWKIRHSEDILVLDKDTGTDKAELIRYSRNVR